MCGPRSRPEMPGQVLGCGHAPVSLAALPAGFSFFSQLLWGAFKHMEKQRYMHKHASGSSKKLTATALWKGHISCRSIMLLWNHTKPSWLAGPGRYRSSVLVLSWFFSKCFSKPRCSFHLTSSSSWTLTMNRSTNQNAIDTPAWELFLLCRWIWGNARRMKLWLQWVNCNYLAWLQ